MYNKYKATKKIVDGARFSSKKEAKRYQQLKLLKAAGEVDLFLRQVPLHLANNSIRYVLDFLVFWNDGHVTFEEVKGYDNPLGKAKRISAEAEYGIKIDVI